MRRLTTISAVICLALGLVGVAHGSQPTSASGTYMVTEITSFMPRTVGNKTVIDQTASGAFSGTLAGPFEDEVTIDIHPNGLVKARGTMTCSCTVAGKSGSLEFVHVTAGEFDEQTFEGRAIIRRATGDLSGLRGVLEIQGTLDENNMATVTYMGWVHSHP